MKRTLLLVTGSRSVCVSHGGTKRSFGWALDTLKRHILNGRPDLIINGGAEGPDRMSANIAGSLGIEWHKYLLDGWIYTVDSMDSVLRVARWRDAEGPVVSPLERNRALVAASVKARNEGWQVHVLGLVAPWAKTHGSDHTIAQAKHAGLEVTRIECPMDYAGASHG